MKKSLTAIVSRLEVTTSEIFPSRCSEFDLMAHLRFLAEDPHPRTIDSGSLFCASGDWMGQLQLFLGFDILACSNFHAAEKQDPRGADSPTFASQDFQEAPLLENFGSDTGSE